MGYGGRTSKGLEFLEKKRAEEMEQASKRRKLEGAQAALENMPDYDPLPASGEIPEYNPEPSYEEGGPSQPLSTSGQPEPNHIEGLPQGWCGCPPMGTPLGFFLPCKTPLGAKHLKKIPDEHHFTPGQCITMAWERFGQEVGLVLDLTNTTRYYDSKDWTEHGIEYVKLPCRGRGQTPEPHSVNAFMWEAMRFQDIMQKSGQPKLMVVHCTHGFNRTGYMIANFIMRVGINVKYSENTLEEALNKFAHTRSPGIYKDHYIEQLYKYHHMRRPSAMKTPSVPAWKGVDSLPGSPGPEAVEEQEQPNDTFQHDDPLGEGIHPEMAEMLQKGVMEACMGNVNQRNLRFPGSQPVSLDLQNMSMLEARRYYVTWKADGTRYMLLIRSDGTYLIDRKFKITRVEMRFPTRDMTPHHFTLLDGEMVVDEDTVSGLRTRRFLVYDLMMSRGKSFIHEGFERRFQTIHDDIIKPRNMDKQNCAAGRISYNYGAELFSTRRKDFWQLQTSQKILNEVIPAMSHESDGLIFQSWQDPYKPGTCDELLKWKFGSHNSVDFLCKLDADGTAGLYLLETRGRRKDHVRLEGARFVIPEGNEFAQSAEECNGKIVECRYLKDEDAWELMRFRVDKGTANAYFVYEKVLKSIKDNITEDKLLKHISHVVGVGRPYDAERKYLAQRGRRP